jgi:hypothetical protein
LVCIIRASTVLRRASDCAGLRSGSYLVGSSTIPASVAAWRRLRFAAVVWKYVSAAASMPQALLGHHVRDLDGLPQLVKLAAQGVGGGRLLRRGAAEPLEHKHALDVLLLDCGAALDRLVLDVVDQGADRALDVEGAARPVAVILDRDDRREHVGRDLVVAYRLPVKARIRLSRAEVHAVYVRDQVSLAVEDLGPLRQVRSVK